MNKLKKKNILIYFLPLIIFLSSILFFRDILNENENLNLEKIDPNFLYSYKFIDELVQYPLHFKNITKDEDIQILNNNILVKLSNIDFLNLDFKILNNEKILANTDLPILKVDFLIDNKKHSSFAYGKRTNKKKAILIIPGSGFNQSSKIYLEEKLNYQYGLKTKLKDNYDVYVFIKPNEDYLAFHNKKNKLSSHMIHNWHINNGGSYSFSYIMQSIAFSEYLKKEYTTTVVAGLSQGGEAAFLNSIYSKPDYTIISSGFSFRHLQNVAADLEQILIPNNVLYNLKNLKNLMKENNKTKFFFSWGKNETDSYYLETQDFYTCNIFKNIVENEVKCYSGSGHEYLPNKVQKFLNE